MQTNPGADENLQEPAKQEPLKVILADDDRDDQEIFHYALNETKIPADLTTVDNGQELIDTLKDPTEPKPDIIFMDINMPKKDGKQALAEIKSDETLKDIPTVMLSTSENQKDVEETFNKGANLYVRKPFSFKAFILMLKKIFTMRWAGILFKPARKTFLMSEKNISDGEMS